MQIKFDLSTAEGRTCATLRHAIGVIREREIREMWMTLFPDRDRRFFANASHPDEVLQVDRTAPAWNNTKAIDLDVHKKEWRDYGNPDATELIFEDWGAVRPGWLEITEDRDRCTELDNYPFRK